MFIVCISWREKYRQCGKLIDYVNVKVAEVIISVITAGVIEVKLIQLHDSLK